MMTPAMAPTLKINAIQVLALSCLGVVAGAWLKRKIWVLDWLNIPASVLGGFVYAAIALLLRDRYLNLEFDLVLRDILMIAFFTTVGLRASLRLVREGGVQVLQFWLAASLGVLLENVLGVGLAIVLGIPPLAGLICGSVTMAGGPGTALAFGQTFEQLGLAGATDLGIAAAMFGIVAGGLLAGFAGGRLIEKYGLRPGTPGKQVTTLEAVAYASDPPEKHVQVLEGSRAAEEASLMDNVAAVAVAMGVGSLISLGIQRMGVVLPAYIGAMIAAAIIRNLDDRWRFAGLAQHHIDDIGNISLNLFIVMALLGLRLWELVHLALPVLVILLAQVVLVWLLSVWLTFRWMRSDYDAAVMAGGYCGFMLGTTANALAAMGVLVEKYGPAPRAILVVSLVGAFLIDFTNATVITAAANLLR
jgi:ESS family glutamate:Na+ symporter